MEEAANAVNTLSTFLAHEQISSVEELNQFLRSFPKPNSKVGTHHHQPTDAIVFCASSVLSLATNVFSSMPTTDTVSSTKIDLEGRNTVLILCGGIGHSTPHLYDAVAQHPSYNAIAKEVQGKAESRVLQLIAERWFGVHALDIGSEGATVRPDDKNKLLVVVEDRSTNCGGNASESRKVLEACGVESPRSIVVVQDPTMSRRTVATFNKAYKDRGIALPLVVSWPTFIPKVRVKDPAERAGKEDVLNQIVYANNHTSNIEASSLWSMKRFVDLLMGEIPRLQDDADGYGPMGKGFIVHVEIPENVKNAWNVMNAILGEQSRDR
ncbi:YdcF domain-containing protein [Colletotrichum incanum]|nr:YdcF domain-containing protein [Colletotrichum incanum]